MAAVVVAIDAGAAASGACRSKSSSASAYLVRSLYWRLRAGLRRLHQSERAGRWRRGTGGGGGSSRFSFHYDALSYALNFDDGSASADFVR